MSLRDELSRYWPPFGLRLRTPRLLLTPLAEEDLPDVAAAVLGGVHDSAEMPFDRPWTDAPRDELVPNSFRWYWSQRGRVAPDDWNLQFGIHFDGAVIGIQDLVAHNFPVMREVSTGSWLSRASHGRGIGTEMRTAVLLLAFDHLQAQRAFSSAYLDNVASLRVSEKLGYQPNGRQWRARRKSDIAEARNFLLTPDTFIRPGWTLQVNGLDECRTMLGANTG